MITTMMTGKDIDAGLSTTIDYTIRSLFYLCTSNSCQGLGDIEVVDPWFWSDQDALALILQCHTNQQPLRTASTICREMVFWPCSKVQTLLVTIMESFVSKKKFKIRWCSWMLHFPERVLMILTSSLKRSIDEELSVKELKATPLRWIIKVSWRQKNAIESWQRT